MTNITNDTEKPSLGGSALNDGLDAFMQIVKPTQYFSKPPYHVETFPIGSCVCNLAGFNCLSFKAPKEGAKFTRLENAKYICKIWNENNVSA